MKCPSCGSRGQTSKFCAECGAELFTEEETAESSGGGGLADPSVWVGAGAGLAAIWVVGMVLAFVGLLIILIGLMVAPDYLFQIIVVTFILWVVLTFGVAGKFGNAFAKDLKERKKQG